jgi:hypothetical protein
LPTHTLTVVLLVLLLVGCASAVESERTRPFWELPPSSHPPTAQIKLRIHDKHPRCIFRPADREGWGRTFEESRRLYKTDARFKAIFDAALAVPFRRQHPAMLAACWIVSGEKKYAEAAVEKLLAESISHTGKPYYSNVWQFALAFDWLHGHAALTDAKRARIVAKIRQRIAGELDGLDARGMAVWHGRSQAANNAMIAVLALVEHLDPKTIRRATAHYVDALRALDTSGGWPEGASYWIYNRAGPYAMAADCVLSATGHETIDGIAIRDVMRKIGLWQLYSYAPCGTFEPFGDSAGSLRLGHTGWWTVTTDHFARISRHPGLMAGADYLRNRSPHPYGRRPYYWHVAFTYDPAVRPAEHKGGRGSSPSSVSPDDAEIDAGRNAPRPLLRYDAKRPEEWMAANLPKAMLFGRESMGVAFFRGEDRPWGTGRGLFASFKAGDLLAHHDHYDAGHFSIHADGPILPMTGLYGPGGYDGKHRLGYSIQTVSANSLLVLAPGETSAYLRGKAKRGWWSALSGGQRVIRPTSFGCDNVNHYREQLNAGPHLERATITAWESVPKAFDTIAADITAAYNSTKWAEPGCAPKVSRVTRRFVYLRPVRSFIVYDRVDTTDKRFLPKFVLHHLSKPSTKTERLLKGESADNGILETTDRVIGASYRDGRLTQTILLPEKARTLKIGGPDFCCYVEADGDQGDGFDGVNLGAGRKEYDKERNTAQLGRWRTELEPTEPTKTTRFLNVLTAWAPHLKPMDVTVRRANVSGNCDAAFVNRTVLVFAREPTPLERIAVKEKGRIDVILLDAAPGGAYRAGAKRVTASKEGVAWFETLDGPAEIEWVK